jgi:hypothetical protein
MSVSDEARDPWSYVVGGLAGGLMWAALAGVAGVAAGPIGLAVGASVFGAKLLSGAFVREKAREYQERRLPVASHSPEEGWLRRARRAQATFREIAGSASAGPIAERVTTFGGETEASIASLERLAGQASAVRTALGRLDPAGAAEERDRLGALIARETDPAARAARQQALASVRAQLDTYGRLTAALNALLARLESGTIGLEGLVARLAEVVALAETSGTAADGLSEVDSLATELEGLRAGLVEAEGVSTRAIQGLAPLPEAATGTFPDSTRQRGRSTE